MSRGELTIRTRRVEGTPVVAIRVVLEGGARAEEVPGQAYVTGRMLAEGTRQRSWKRLAEDLEAKGMALSTSSTFETEGLSFDALALDWELALAWAAEITFEPAFPADRCLWITRQVAAELESLGDQPEVRAAWTFLEQLYSPHPRCRRLQGSAESLAVLAAEHCRSFHEAALGRRLLVCVAGEIDEDAVHERIGELFASAAGRAPEPPVISPPRGGERRCEVQLKGADQAHLYLGHLTVPRNHPDLVALETAAIILGAGSGLTGRIPTRIREQEGLAYTTYAQTAAGAGLDAGRLVAYVGTSPRTVAKAERVVIDELERFLEDGAKPEEVAEARAYLLGREPFRRETARQWAEMMVEAAFYGLPLDDPAWRQAQLEAIDQTAVEAAARRHLKPDELYVTVGRP